MNTLIKKTIIIIIISLLIIFFLGNYYVAYVIENGDKYYSKENYQKAIEEYSKGDIIFFNSEIKEKKVLSENKLLLLNVLKKGDRNIKDGNFQKAIAYYSIAINKYNSEDSYFYRGLAYFKLSDFKKSRNDFKNFELASRTDILLDKVELLLKNLLYKGLAEYNLEDYRGSIISFNKIFEIMESPTHKLSLIINDSEDNGLKKNPIVIKAYIELGNSYYKLNKINEACISWSKAGELGEDKAYDLIKKYCN